MARKRVALPDLYALDLLNIRKLALEKRLYKSLIIFEIIYKFRLHDLTLLQDLTSENYNKDTHTFNVEGFEHIDVGKFLDGLLTNHNFKGFKNESSTHPHFLKLSELIGKDVRYINIKKLHDIMHWTCAKCEQKYETFAENWNLKKEPYGMITCIHCANEEEEKNLYGKMKIVANNRGGNENERTSIEFFTRK